MFLTDMYSMNWPVGKKIVYLCPPQPVRHPLSYTGFVVAQAIHDFKTSTSTILLYMIMGV